MTKDTIRIGQVKVEPVMGDLEANHRRLMAVLNQVRPGEVDVAVTPECFLDGYVARDPQVDAEGLRAYAIDPADSPYARDLAAWAADRAAWLVWGCTRWSEIVRESLVAHDSTSHDNQPGADALTRCWNSAVVFDRAGRIAGVYDKVHLQAHDRKFAPGAALPVFSSDFGPFGVMICADRRWPETVRSLVIPGARVIFNPTYGMWNDLNLAMMRTRSYESEVFIAFTHPGQALVTGPRGEVLRNETDEEIDWVVTEIDLREADAARSGEMSWRSPRPARI